MSDRMNARKRAVIQSRPIMPDDIRDIQAVEEGRLGIEEAVLRQCTRDETFFISHVIMELFWSFHHNAMTKPNMDLTK